MRVQHLTELDADAYTRLMRRSSADVQRVMPAVQDIMEAVQQRGDAALRDYTARFDGVDIPDAGFNADLHASAAYRAHLVGVMARRCVTDLIG